MKINQCLKYVHNYRTLFFLLAILISIQGKLDAFTPPNNLCENAINLAINTNGACANNLISGTTSGASAHSFPNHCSDISGNQAVWYKFTVPASGVLNLSINSISGYHRYVLFQNENCADIGSNSSDAICPFAGASIEYATFSNLTIGQTYFLAVVTARGPTGNLEPGDFTICLQDAPTNDKCENAIPISVNTAGSCAANEVAGTTYAASNDGATSCGNSISWGVWYKFTAISEAVYINLNNTITHRIAVFDACSGSEVFCEYDPDNKTIKDLTIGNEYRLLIWTNQIFLNHTFNLCLEVGVNNDACVDAVAIPVNVGGDCGGNEIVGSTFNAKDDGEHSCSAANKSLGVWYKFTAPSNGRTLMSMTSNTSGVSFQATVFDACDAGANEVACFTNPNGAYIENLTGGQVYYINVFAFGIVEGNFSLCLEEAYDIPTNDLCTGSIQLTVNPFDDCLDQAVDGTNFGATIDAAPFSFSLPAYGVWYHFTAPVSGQVVIEVLPQSSNSSFSYNLMSSCTNNANFQVYDGNSTWTGLVPGNTYYIPIWSGNVNLTGDFKVCLKEAASTPPINDDCANATAIDIESEGDNCSTPFFLTNENATNSATTNGTPNCNYNGDDVWVKFVAPTSGNVKLTLAENNWGIVLAGLYEHCSQTTEIDCQQISSHLINNFQGWNLLDLNAGSTYFLRLWEYYGSTAGHIAICLESLPSTPANDECSGAIEVVVNPEGSGCFNPIIGDNTLMTNSAPSNGTPSCNFFAGGDLWYKFTAPASKGIKIDIFSPGIGTDVALYNDCGDMVEISCERISNEFKNLITGNEYYLRVWDEQNNNFGTFELCIEALPFPPPNDECVNAINLTVRNAGDCTGNAISGTTIQSSDEGMQSCASYEESTGVWYQFTAPNSGAVQTNLSGDHIKMTVFDGCGGNELACYDSPDNPILNGLQSGLVYKLLIWTEQFDEQEDFTICIENYALCTNASLITVSANGECNNNIVNGTTIGSLNYGNLSCEQNENFGVWYQFEAPTSGAIIYELSNYTSGNLPNVSFFDACGGSEIHCDKYRYQVADLTAGNTYYLYVNSDENEQTNFSLCIHESPAPPANDLCTNSITVPIRPKNGCTFNNRVHGTLVGATDDPEPSCTSTAPLERNGVWYNFVAPSSGSVKLDAFSHNSFSYPDKMVVYDDCNGNEIFCSTFPSSSDTIKNLVGGQTYQINIFNYAGKEGDFSFCLEDVVQGIPSCTTYHLPEDMQNNVGNTTQLFWDEVSAATGYKIHLGTDGGGTTTPTNLINDTVLNAGGPPFYEVNGLATSTTYYWQIIPFDDNGDALGCAIWSFETAPIPSNNLCSNAIELIPNTTCQTQLYTNLGSNNSMQLPLPTCKSMDSDVWFKVRVPASGDLTIETQLDSSKQGLFDVDMEIYSGDCSGLTAIACGGDIAPNPAPPNFPNLQVKLTISNPNLANQLVFIRVWGGFSQQGNFNICAHDPSVENSNCSPCDTIHLQNTIFTGDSTFIACDSIHSTMIVQNDASNNLTSVTYQAGLSIKLLPGFHAKTGVNFTAKIMACSASLNTKVDHQEVLAKQRVLKEQNTEETNLSIFPNPFTNTTNIQFNLPESSTLQINLYNLNGQLIKTVFPHTTVDKGMHQIELTAEHLNSGVYFLSLQTAKERLTQKIILK